MKNRGMFFTFDAVFALMIVIVFVSVFSIIYISNLSPQMYQERLSIAAEDAMNAVSNIKISDIQNEQVITDLRSRGVLAEDDMNRTLIDVLGWMWSSQNATYLEAAENITENIFTKIMPKNVQWALQIENDTIYCTSVNDVKVAASVARRMVSGYMKSQPSAGYVAKVFLKNIGGKGTASYIFYGGFVGEGNITSVVDDIPGDAVIKSIYMEMNAGSNFTLLVNGYPCGNFSKNSTEQIAVNNWTILGSDCLNHIALNARNNFTIVSLGTDISKSYIGGGYIRIAYETSRLLEPENYSRFYLPGIDGIINYYDSFYVPGNITSMSIHLEFYNNYSMYFNIGNATVLNNTGSNETQIVDITNATLAALLNYTLLSYENVPIHMASTIANITRLGNADVILITDTSGSMDMCLNSTRSNCPTIGCDDYRINTTNQDRISKAKCLDKDFVRIVLGVSGNRIGLVTYSYNASMKASLQSNATNLISIINGFDTGGGTCICCAERMARLMLQQQSNATRAKYIIVMTDGLANERCYPYNGCYPDMVGHQECQRYQPDENRTSCCSGYNGSSTNYCPSPWCRIDTDSVCNDAKDDIAINNSIDDSCRARNDTGALIDAIGMGPVSRCPAANMTLRGIASCGGGSYYASSDANELQAIYQTIAGNILNQTLTRQVVTVAGNFSYAKLYPNSYIEFGYESNVSYGEYQNISVRQETDLFASCNGSFFVPQQMKVTDAKATSYSGDYWTHNASFKSPNTGNSWRNIFWLGKYGSSYAALGDPYVIHFDGSMVASNATNYIELRLGTNSTNTSSYCSAKNRVIYTARIKASVPYGALLPSISGFNVSVYYDNNHDGIADGPVNVLVGQDLDFNSTAITVDKLRTDNALHEAFLRMLDQLNFVVMPGNTGRAGSVNNPIDVKLSESLDIDYANIRGVPYFWGPADVNIVVWV